MHVLAAMQVTGQAGGIQVPGASLAGVMNMGGAAVANFVSILEPLRAEPLRSHVNAARTERRQRRRSCCEGGIMATFRALVLHEEGGKVVAGIEAVDEARLPPGEVNVAVEYSTLNYKDGMILQGIGRLVRELSAYSRHRFRRHRRALGFARVQARRPGGADRLAGRRGALGRLRRKGAGQGRASWCACRRG